MRQVALRHVASIRVSNVDKKSVDGETTVRLCNYMDVYGRNFIRNDQHFMVATATRDQINAFRLQPGDVIITKDSETSDDIGVPALVETSSPDLVCGYHLAVLRPDPKQVDARFLYWSMASDPAREQFAVTATGVTRFGLRTESISKLVLGVPTLTRQRAIADFLDAETGRSDQLLSLKHRMRQLALDIPLAEMRQHILEATSVCDPFGVAGQDVPVGWQALRLGADLRFGSGTTPESGESRYYGPGTPWVVTGNLRDLPLKDVAGSVTPLARAQYPTLRVHPSGSLVVAMYGATTGRLGILTAPATVNQACCVVHSGSRIDTHYLFYYMMCFRDALLERSVGAGQPNISQEILRSLRIAVPPRDQQAMIVSLIEARLQAANFLSAALERQIALLKERRQALITAAVTGQLDIPGS